MAKKRKMKRIGRPTLKYTGDEVYRHKSIESDWLKYLRVARYQIKRKYGIHFVELELLLFLNSEGLFNRRDFKEFCQIYSWRKNRLQDLVKRGYIYKWREHKGHDAALWEVTEKTKRICAYFYQILEYKAPIAESRKRNKIFSDNSSYTDKGYRRAIRRYNAEREKRDAQIDSWRERY